MDTTQVQANKSAQATEVEEVDACFQPPSGAAQSPGPRPPLESSLPQRRHRRKRCPSSVLSTRQAWRRFNRHNTDPNISNLHTPKTPFGLVLHPAREVHNCPLGCN